MKITKNVLSIFLFALSFLVLSCSGDNDNLPEKEEPTTPVQTKHFNPPLWIQGTWHTTKTPTTRLKFTKDDIISLNDNSSLNDQINKSKTTNLIWAVEDEGASNTLYYYTLTFRPVGGGPYGDNKFRVQKINDTLMLRAPDFSYLIYYVKEKD
ncbi:hypothetical protein [Chryseobacterium sp.]|jgi:hypothetical protein|uniref:hypothetical protein n=1 Tax=unclassified Chryseobacterium TaxID=2593645 RepID=UPI00284B7AA6|nr:hypothetical protein [Chryseobacterium sp.]MDR3025601.1 hypothetical protein [Chryseobacterium sp.]WPO91595.1 hypothetical protein SFA27_02655 [Chryseobacterium sp. HR92]